jgi:hypothetical protein
VDTRAKKHLHLGKDFFYKRNPVVPTDYPIHAALHVLFNWLQEKLLPR